MIRARQYLSLIAAAAVAFGAWSCDDDDESTAPTREDFAATLTGGAEVPAVVVATTATGTAAVSFTGSGPITYTVTATGLTSTATMAHIHGPADASTAAQIVAPLTISATGLGVTATGTITTTAVATISLDSLKKMMRAGRAYINVHTASNPAGEVRGQLIAQ